MKTMDKKSNAKPQISHHGLPCIARSPVANIQRQQIGQILRNNTIQAKPNVGQPKVLVQRQTEPKREEEMGQMMHVPEGAGQALPASERAFFEPRFGMDFSSVRMHDNPRAAQTAKSLNAKAFTLGRDLVFGAGQYCPGENSGRRLLAHELTHVVQQTGDKVQRQANGKRNNGVAVTPVSADAIQRQVKDVKQAELANFFSVPEPGLPINLAQKYLTDPTLMAIQHRVLWKLVFRVQKKQAPLTPDQFLALVRTMTADHGTALLVCHNVTKALARGKSPIGWKNVSRKPLVYDFNGATIRFNPNRFHRDAVKYGRLGITAFYAMFSADPFGVDDDGDWYHYYVTATASFYGASSKLIDEKPKKGTDFTGESVRKVMAEMKDNRIKDSAAYRGWRYANAMSFLEGTGFGKGQAEVDRESMAHLMGASAGLAGVGAMPGENWSWYVPKAGIAFDIAQRLLAGRILLSPHTIKKTKTGIKGRFKLLIVNGTTPDKWYDTPDAYVEFENTVFGRLLSGGGKTSTQSNTTTPVWNEHLTTLDYDGLRSVSLKMIDEDSISDDPIVNFNHDLRPAGRRVTMFLLASKGSTLRIRVEAEGDIILKDN